VSWSQKVDNDDDFKRLGLAKARELKQLRDEFKDIITPAAPSGPPKKTELPPGDREGESPDKQSGKPGDNRVKPVDDQPKGQVSPTVKPDEQKGNQPKAQPKTQPKNQTNGSNK
jgi:hypothetical protein